MIKINHAISSASSAHVLFLYAANLAVNPVVSLVGHVGWVDVARKRSRARARGEMADREKTVFFSRARARDFFLAF